MNDALQIWQFAIPIALAAIGEVVSQRSGVLNIGLEGTMLSGAFVAAWVTFATGQPWLGVAAGLVIGVILALIQAWLVLGRSVDQVVVGTGVNLLALGASGTLFRRAFGESGQLLSLATLPKFNGIDSVMLATPLLAILLAIAIKRTGWGLLIRASGEYPKAVEAEGYSVARLRLGAIVFGGALAGLAGAYLSVGIVGSFAENMTQGRGFVAIALVTFGRWHPIAALAAALLMGALEWLQFKLQAQGSGLIPFQLLLALPYIVALLVLVFGAKGTRGPAALGQPLRSET